MYHEETISEFLFFVLFGGKGRNEERSRNDTEKQTKKTECSSKKIQWQKKMFVPTMLLPLQTPAVHISLSVFSSPSSQDAPSASFRSIHEPSKGSHSANLHGVADSGQVTPAH